VIHHRVIDVRFFVSRAIVLGVIAGSVASMIAGLDWLFSTQLPNSRLQMAIYVGFALIVGLLLNPAWKYVTRMIDAISFKKWRRTQEHAAQVAATVREANSANEVLGPLTQGIGEAFSLASAAVFERLEDGGFVRVAACGWPKGTLWHILPDEPIIRTLHSRRAVKAVDALKVNAAKLPSGTARPTVIVPILAGRNPVAVLFYGAHVNGAAIDPDELRLLQGLASECASVFIRAGVGKFPSAVAAY
jgi:hypothetical protein